MIIQCSLLSLFVVIALTACSSSTSDNHTDTPTQVEIFESSDKAQMKIYLNSAESQLLWLAQQETKHCISGQLSIAYSLLAQATNEHDAKMNKDAFITLVELDRQMRKIRCINQYLNRNLGCGYTNKKIVLKRWYREGDFHQCKKSAAIKVTTVDKSTSGNKHILITETLHDFNQNNIKPIYFQALNTLVDLMRSYPNSTLLISGHADSKGTAAYNIKLSLQRANNVAKYFTDRGIEASQLSIKSQGESNIRELEQSDVSRVFNRYTSITLFLDSRDKKTI